MQMNGVPRTCNGKCRGGPYDGMLLLHFEPVFPFRKDPENLEVEAVKIGEYRFSGGLWTWYGA